MAGTSPAMTTRAEIVIYSSALSRDDPVIQGENAGPFG
jgi:hypothetical protein